MAAVLAIALAATPGPGTTPCFQSIKFGGALYLDTGQVVPSGQVGSRAGETDPNPAPCGLPDRLTVFHVAGHTSTEEIAYRPANGSYELYTSAGQSGFPAQGILRWLVAGLALLILLFAAVPAVAGHLRQPPVEVPDEPST